jgi:hypothetical protein
MSFPARRWGDRERANIGFYAAQVNVYSVNEINEFIIVVQ